LEIEVKTTSVFYTLLLHGWSQPDRVWWDEAILSFSDIDMSLGSTHRVNNREKQFWISQRHPFRYCKITKKSPIGIRCGSQTPL